jgi:hypothetical protein
MEPFVVNSRRWPRVPARCRVDIAAGGAQWKAATVDVGPWGCQLVSPQDVATGTEVKLAIANQALAERLLVAGRIAWKSQTIPVRLGVVFTGRHASIDPRNWYVRLLQADRAVASTVQHVPQRLSADTTIFLGEPPYSVTGLNPTKVEVLRLIGDGVRIAQIVERHTQGPEKAVQAIFSLLECRAVTLSRADAVTADLWSGVLTELEAAFAAVPPADPPPRSS